MSKALKVWAVYPSVKVKPDTLTEDTQWLVGLMACRGEYESTQLVLRTEVEPVRIHIELENLIQALGEKIFDVNHFQLRLTENERLIPLPEVFILEPRRTQAILLTVYVPKEIEPCAYIGNITLRTDTEEIAVTLSVKVLDIEMPAIDIIDLKEFAGRYGLEWLANACAQELREREPESSIRWETLRDAGEDIRLLWLLEQAQTMAAEQRGVAFDPTAWGKKICAPIIKDLSERSADISALRAVREDLIAAIQEARIPYVDAGDTLTVRAMVAPTTPADFAYGTEGRFYFQFHLEWSPADRVQAGDRFRFTFRDLFSDACTFLERPIEAPLSGQTKVILTAEDVTLKPSSYHVRVDVMRGDHSLSPKAPGGCQVYVTREGESQKHMFVSFSASRLAYMWDEKQKIYYSVFPGNLYPSGDPFDPAARPIYEWALRLEIARMRFFGGWPGRHPMEVCVPEQQHDGGSGILRAAGTFRKMGETERACFCEQAVKRIINAVLHIINSMLAKKIETHEKGEAGITFYGPRQQHNLLLKLLCDAYLYFRDVAGDEAYSQTLYEPIRLIGEYQMAQPNVLGASEGKVYDGRVLVGLCTYCLAERAMHGEFIKAHVDTVLDFASRISEHTVFHRGWHDNDGMEGHDGYGTMNVLWGLLPARRIALTAGREDLAEALKKGILTAFDFLARTNGCITGYTQWIPSRHGGWCAGDVYEMLDEMERQFGENKILKWYRLHLCDRDITSFVKLTSGYERQMSSLGSHNVLSAFLMECEEYKDAVVQD